MDNKTKQIVGIGVGVGAISVVSVLGVWYYYKKKKQREFEQLLEEGEKDVAENYQDDRPRLSKLKSAIVNKLYPQDYRTLPRTQQKILDDLEEYERRHARRGRFTVFDSVQSRFKILETHGDKGVMVRGTGRLRTSGDIYKRTESGYSKRNANFSDLDIPNNQPRDYRGIW